MSENFNLEPSPENTPELIAKKVFQHISEKLDLSEESESIETSFRKTLNILQEQVRLDLIAKENAVKQIKEKSDVLKQLAGTDVFKSLEIAEALGSFYINAGLYKLAIKEIDLVKEIVENSEFNGSDLWKVQVVNLINQLYVKGEGKVANTFIQEYGLEHIEVVEPFAEGKAYFLLKNYGLQSILAYLEDSFNSIDTSDIVDSNKFAEFRSACEQGMLKALLDIDEIQLVNSTISSFTLMSTQLDALTKLAESKIEYPTKVTAIFTLFAQRVRQILTEFEEIPEVTSNEIFEEGMDYDIVVEYLMNMVEVLLANRDDNFSFIEECIFGYESYPGALAIIKDYVSEGNVSLYLTRAINVVLKIKNHEEAQELYDQVLNGLKEREIELLAETIEDPKSIDLEVVKESPNSFADLINNLLRNNETSLDEIIRHMNELIEIEDRIIARHSNPETADYFESLGITEDNHQFERSSPKVVENILRYCIRHNIVEHIPSLINSKVIGQKELYRIATMVASIA